MIAYFFAAVTPFTVFVAAGYYRHIQVTPVAIFASAPESEFKAEAPKA